MAVTQTIQCPIAAHQVTNKLQMRIEVAMVKLMDYSLGITVDNQNPQSNSRTSVVPRVETCKLDCQNTRGVACTVQCEC